MKCYTYLSWSVMARSHAVWVVTSERYPWPVGAFTVLGELKLWWANQDADDKIWMHVWRCENPAFSVGGRYRLYPDPNPPKEIGKDVLST